MFNSLSQTLLKLTSPGVPDIYQGTELWDFSLVDPDNRRPVDYGLRRRLLAQVDRVAGAKGVARLLDAPEDGRIKLFVTSRALRFRTANRDLFDNGSYVPLQAIGKQGECMVGFARRAGDKSVLVVAPRFSTQLSGGATNSAAPVGGAWGDSSLELGEDLKAQAGAQFRNVFTGEIIEVQEHDGHMILRLPDVFATLPVALLESI